MSVTMYRIDAIVLSVFTTQIHGVNTPIWVAFWRGAFRADLADERHHTFATREPNSRGQPDGCRGWSPTPAVSHHIASLRAEVLFSDPQQTSTRLRGYCPV